MHRLVSFAAALALLGACSSSSAQSPSSSGTQQAPPVPPELSEAIFAGGCFWCMERPFEALEGVRSVTAGYTGGHVQAPTYGQVSSGRTGHVEAVRIVFDPSRIGYARLLEVYWRNIDPTQPDGQFCDRGESYESAIFVVSAEQRRLAEASRDRVAERLRRSPATRIVDAGPFWVAEDYHQDFYRTHPTRYRAYRAACGRDRRLREVWGEAPSH